MNILITAPSLETKNNVSGVSSVVNNILETTDLNYMHFEVGKQDKEKRNLFWILKQLYLPIKLFNTFLFNKIDIFHLNAPLNEMGVFRDFTLLLVAKIFRKKVLVHFHGGKFLINPPENMLFLSFLKFYFNLADVIVTLSEYEKNLTIKQYDIKEKKITFLENCVIPIENTSNKLKEKEKVRIIFLGRIVDSKGILQIIEAMKLLYKSRQDFEFYLYGTGPLEKKVIEELSILDTCFKYCGIISGKEKEKALLEADIFLLPSLYGEGLPIALLEAMNTNNICIVTNDGSMAEVIEDDVSGFIISKDNVNELFQAITKSIDIIKNNDLTIIRNAKEKINTRFNCHTYSKNLKILYKELINA